MKIVDVRNVIPSEEQKAVVRENMIHVVREYGLFHKLLGLNTKTISFVAVEKQGATYRIVIGYTRQGVFGVKSWTEYHMECFPGCDDYAWFTRDEDEAIAKCIDLEVHYGVNKNGQ